MARKQVPNEIRLVAFTRDDAGMMTVYDIIETSYHYASFFMRRFYRDPECYAVAAVRAGDPVSAGVARPLVR